MKSIVLLVAAFTLTHEAVAVGREALPPPPPDVSGCRQGREIFEDLLRSLDSFRCFNLFLGDDLPRLRRQMEITRSRLAEVKRIFLQNIQRASGSGAAREAAREFIRCFTEAASGAGFPRGRSLLEFLSNQSLIANQQEWFNALDRSLSAGMTAGTSYRDGMQFRAQSAAQMQQFQQRYLENSSHTSRPNSSRSGQECEEVRQLRADLARQGALNQANQNDPDHIQLPVFGDPLNALATSRACTPQEVQAFVQRRNAANAASRDNPAMALQVQWVTRVMAAPVLFYAGLVGVEVAAAAGGAAVALSEAALFAIERAGGVLVSGAEEVIESVLARLVATHSSQLMRGQLVRAAVASRSGRVVQVSMALSGSASAQGLASARLVSAQPLRENTWRQLPVVQNNAQVGACFARTSAISRP